MPRGRDGVIGASQQQSHRSESGFLYGTAYALTPYGRLGRWDCGSPQHHGVAHARACWQGGGEGSRAAPWTALCLAALARLAPVAVRATRGAS